MKKKFLNRQVHAVLILLIAFSVLLFGCTSGSSSSNNAGSSDTPAPSASSGTSSNESKPGGPKYGGTLRMAEIMDGALIGVPTKMNPPLYAQRQVVPAIETLFRLNEKGEPVPFLVESYTSDADAKTLTLNLRKGIKFHDDTDFNAEAVKWNLQQWINAKSLETANITSLDVVDDHTLKISFSKWDNSFISSLAYFPGQMISPTSFEKNGEEWAASHPVGTGPFKFVSSEKGVKTVFEKFDGYWQEGKPYLDKIEWIPIADNVSRVLALKNKEVDFALTVTAKEAGELEQQGYNVVTAPTGSGSMSLMFDAANPNSPFSKLEVRQAVQHAIDREAIAKDIYYGKAEAANQYVYKGHWGYNPDVVGYPYDPEKAKQLLAQAGYPNGFKTKITYTTKTENDLTFTAMQAYLKAVGIEVELVPETTAKVTGVTYNGGQWEGMIYNGPTGNPDLAGVYSQRLVGGKYFASSLFPDDYKQAVQKAVSAPDLETKQKYVHEASKLLIDEYALQFPIVAWKESSASHPYVHDVGFFDTPSSLGWTPENAWLDK